jgi:heme exporter protein A
MLGVEGLACRRGARTVFQDVAFAVPAGRVLALRGPNGAGKSTLLRCLAGLMRPTSGRIVLDGVDLAADPDAVQERIGWFGHADAIKPGLSVAENLAFWSGIAGGSVAGVAERLGIAALAGRPAGACSAGQKRRLGLARLLLAPRRLWLLDEPTSSLDAGGAALFAEILRDHLAGGGIAVIATHVDLGLAADRYDLPGAAAA